MSGQSEPMTTGTMVLGIALWLVIGAVVCYWVYSWLAEWTWFDWLYVYVWISIPCIWFTLKTGFAKVFPAKRP